MPATHVMTGAERMCLRSASRDLHARYRGVFGTETIETLLFASYDQLAATATVHNWLVTGAERYARQRLEALAHARSCDPGKVPSVLFLCVHNAGRSRWPWAGCKWPRSKAGR
jgi:arsenate reductase